MLAQLRLVPNQLTLVRGILIPVLWAFALTGHSVWLGVGLAVAFFTDVADGFNISKVFDAMRSVEFAALRRSWQRNVPPPDPASADRRRIDRGVAPGHGRHEPGPLLTLLRRCVGVPE